MTSLGYSEFNGSNGNVGTGTSGNDGYIASKRKNKTVKVIDGFTSNHTNNANSNQDGRVNPKLERLKESIAKIHASSSSDDEDDDTSSSSAATTNALPTYPGQAVPNANLKISPPIADAGSQLPPTTNEGRTQQPMFSMSQQFGTKSGSPVSAGSAGVEQFKMNAPSTYASQYYKQFAPYNYNRLSNELAGPGANEEFIEKLNYIIHLLEEQHNERTEHVTEELVLYCFLGVFIIFIVDSFARAGKYTR
jgi:hypothetical protein